MRFLLDLDLLNYSIKELKVGLRIIKIYLRFMRDLRFIELNSGFKSYWDLFKIIIICLRFKIY